MTQHYVSTKIVVAWPEDKDGQAGYAVKYPDGYRSWCPKDAFDKANIALGHIGHLADWQQRLCAEYRQLQDKLVKLDVFINTLKLNKSPHEDLAEQAAAMHAYAAALEKRMADFVEFRKPTDGELAESQADQARQADFESSGSVFPKVTTEQIDALMQQVTYETHIVPGTTTTIATAMLKIGLVTFTLANEFTACVDARNFNAQLGAKYAIEKAAKVAREKLWELEGYVLGKQIVATCNAAAVL